MADTREDGLSALRSLARYGSAHNNDNSGTLASMLMALQRFNAQGEFSTTKQGELNLKEYGGRVGYTHPANNGEFNIGVSGGGVRGSYGDHKISGGGVGGVDLRYTTGNDSFSLSHNPVGASQDNMFEHIRAGVPRELFENNPVSRNLTQVRWGRRF